MEEIFFSGVRRERSAEISNSFDLLSEEHVFLILDFLSPSAKKSFSLVCKSFHAIESTHRKNLKPFRLELLPSVLKRYVNVTDLDLSLCRGITDPDLNVVANSCKASLRRIDLSRPGLFSSTGLLILALNCKNLVEIDLSNATDLRDEAAAAVAEAKNLEKLWLARCSLITDMGIGCITDGCRKLRLISLKWCSGIRDLGVGLIAVKCQEIRSLDLSYLLITDKCLPSILKLKHLDDLSLEGCFGIDDDSLSILKVGCRTLKVTLALANTLGKLSKLQSLKLDGCLVTCVGLKAIGNWSGSLRELSLSKCLGVSDEGLSSIVTKHKNLRKLDITCCQMITDVSIARITNSCTLLQSIWMESCSVVSQKAFYLIGQRCRALEELDLTNNEITDEVLKFISHCSNLSILKLGFCLGISDKGLEHIGRGCSKLIKLDLSRCEKITDCSVISIARGCPRLKMINIADCKNVSDTSLLALSKFSRLNTIEVRGVPQITSLGLAAIIIGCKELIELDVKSLYNIDDLEMVLLAHFSQDQVLKSDHCVVGWAQNFLRSFVDLMSYVMRMIISNLQGFWKMILISFMMLTMAALLYIFHLLLSPRPYLIQH